MTVNTFRFALSLYNNEIMKELKRIYNILELFENCETCSKEDLLKASSEGEKDRDGNPKIISYETWNRLRKKMIEIYGFEVVYHKGSDSYSLEYMDQLDRDKLMKLIHHFKAMQVLQYSLEENKEMVELLEFEPCMSTGEETHLTILQRGMIENQQVKLTHQGYRSDEMREIIVNPLYFKQYQNRWYLIGELPYNGEFRSFGMDRIKSVKYTGKNFINRIKEAKARFDEIVGVDLAGNGLQDVVIAFDPTQKPYLETLKLHHCQVVVKDTEDKYIIKIRVNPNYELQQQIQKYGCLAEVIEGDWVCW